MVFSTNIFLFIFLPVTLIVYFLLDEKYRNVFLLLASLFFYFWGEPRFVLVMIASILLNYVGGIVIEATQKKTEIVRKLIIAIFLVLNLGMLVIYKYLDFFIDTFNFITRKNIPLLEIALPIGISFFTFQGLSYLVDVYRGDVIAQKNPLSLGLYISMFPQLIAGPIVRYIDVEKEITNRSVDLEKFVGG